MAETVRPKAELISITASDGLILPALYFAPEKSGAPLAIWLHGMGTTASFYAVDRINALAHFLTSSRVGFLALNNRGAHLLQDLKFKDSNGEYQKRTQGTSHELIADCIYDIDGAIDFARAKGHNELFLLGHSTGANKVCVYHYKKKDSPFRGYVLFGGGDDTGIFYGELGESRFYDLLQEAKHKVEQGQGSHLVPESFGVGPFSYQSIGDILDPDGDYNTFPFTEASTNLRLSTKELFHYFKSIDKPTLVVYGSLDEYCPPSARVVVKTLLRQTPHPELFSAKLIPGADHSAHGHEEELAHIITDWLMSNLGDSE